MEAMKEVSVAESMLQCIRTHLSSRKHGIVNLRKLNPLSCLGLVKLLPWLSCEAHSLLKGDPTLRLGSWTRGCHDIKNHKWVNEIASES
ncbi:putative non-specific serine/threonine protein kinase [Helianthus annuus]|nr:putative non-specific serine/threonine protein kinase [Helianthus annuus]